MDYIMYFRQYLDCIKLKFIIKYSYTINDLNENNSIVMGFNVPNIQNIIFIIVIIVIAIFGLLIYSKKRKRKREK